MSIPQEENNLCFILIFFSDYKIKFHGLNIRAPLHYFELDFVNRTLPESSTIVSP